MPQTNNCNSFHRNNITGTIIFSNRSTSTWYGLSIHPNNLCRREGLTLRQDRWYWYYTRYYTDRSSVYLKKKKKNIMYVTRLRCYYTDINLFKKRLFFSDEHKLKKKNKKNGIYLVRRPPFLKDYTRKTQTNRKFQKALRNQFYLTRRKSFYSTLISFIFFFQLLGLN